MMTRFPQNGFSVCFTAKEPAGKFIFLILERLRLQVDANRFKYIVMPKDNVILRCDLV